MVIISHYQVLKKDKVPRYEGIVVYRSTEGSAVEGTVGEIHKYLEGKFLTIICCLSDKEKEPFKDKFDELSNQIALGSGEVEGKSIEDLSENIRLRDDDKRVFMELQIITEQLLSLCKAVSGK